MNSDVHRMMRVPRRGFALLSALWLLVVMGTLGTVVAVTAHNRRLCAANVLERTQAYAASNAGIAQVRARATRVLQGIPDDVLMQQGVIRANLRASWQDPWSHVDSVTADSIPLGDAWYRVAMRDPASAININLADETVLYALFVALGVDAGDANRMTHCIADWRDGDAFRHLHGAERADYLDEGLPDLPRNALFGNVAELAHVKGFTPAMFDRVAPYVTLHGFGRVNLNTASRPVLLALPGIGEEAADAIVRARAAGRPVRSLEALSALLSLPARTRLQDASAFLLPIATFTTMELEVTSDGWVGGSPVHARTTALLARSGAETLVTWTRAE